jgi:hypothetical protein
MTVVEKIAVVLIAGSWVVAAGILLLPFLEMKPNRLVVAAGVYFVSQVIFWAGCAIGGRELVRRYRQRFPWLSWTGGLRRKR